MLKLCQKLRIMLFLLDYYRKRGSASYIVREVHLVRERERERDTETDGRDVIIVALKLAMSLHFPLPKLRTIGNEITRSLAKSSHFSFPLHTSRLSLHHCGAEIRNEITLSVAKKFRPLSRFRLSKWRKPRDK